MKYFTFFVLILISAIFTPPARSSSTQDYYIKTRLNTTYDPAGTAASNLTLTIRNLTSANYPLSIKVDIHGEKIDISSIKDDYGDLSYVYSYLPTGINTIEVKFNRRMVGKDVLSHLYLKYAGQDAIRSENTWIVFFPKISIGTSSDFQYYLTIPDSFGRLIAAQTMPESNPNGDNTTTYSLAGKSLNLSNRLIFGLTYPFSFKLVYPPSSQIILPADTATQKIYIQNLNPTPHTLKLQNNYWVAEYPQQTEGITVTGYSVFFQSDSQLDIPNQSQYSVPDLIETAPHPYQYLPTKPVSLTLNPPSFFWPFVQNEIILEIKNPNFQALYNNVFTLDSPGMEITTGLNPVIPVIPPSGDIYLPVKVRLTPLHLFSPKNLNINIADTAFSYNISPRQLIYYYIINCVVISASLIIIIYLALIARRLYFQRSGR